MDINTYSLITTGILAVAAILTYLVQRARYLREIEPDLELKWPDAIRVIEMTSTLKKFWAFYIDVEVENRSKNHAEDLRYEVELEIFPQRGKPTFLGGKIREILRMHPAEVLAGRKITIPVYCGSNIGIDLQTRLDSWDSSLIVENVGFMATVTILYFSRRELVLWFLLKLGRIKYNRKIFGTWKFQIDKRDKLSYISQPWEFGEA